MSMNLLLRNRQPPGDVLMLTAAVRDLHRAHPRAYRTAIDTACPSLWENNPFIVPLSSDWNADRVIECEYPLIHHANHRPYHFIHGFLQDLEQKLGVSIPVGAFRGDVYLSPEEMQRPSPVAHAGHDGPYWVAAAGGKYDFTAKWWDPAAWQAVVDHFRGRIRFVHCGAAGDYHPPLDGVVDLVGKTTVREFIRVIHHADGVLCPVTFAMHLAAAVPTRKSQVLRPCVVVAGGREPAHWEQYPGHQFLHTVGALDCCATGGCWKARCQPLGDGDPCDASLCVRPVPVRGGLQVAQCMTLITPSRVIDAINLYYQGGVLPCLPAPVPTRIKHASPTPPDPTSNHPSPTAAQTAQTAKRPPVAVTIGVGTYAEIAHLAAREMELRTGLRTVVLGDREFAASGLEDPTFLKFRLFDLLDADDVLYFDADTVCLTPWDPTRQPSPLFGSDHIVCVRERMIPLILYESALWSVPTAEHFNAGLFIINRRHHSAWLRRAEEIRHARDTLLHEQLPLNAARVEMNIPLKLIDRRYNWIGFGAGTLSHDFPVVLAHRLAPGRQELNVAYFKGEYALNEPRLVPDDEAAKSLHGRVFTFHDGAAQRRTIRFRDDGTVVPHADPPDPGYWFVHTLRGRPTLALASETAILHQFVRVLDGTWVGLSPSGHVDASLEGPRLIETADGPGGPLNEDTARPTADAFVRMIPAYPGEEESAPRRQERQGRQGEEKTDQIREEAEDRSREDAVESRITSDPQVTTLSSPLGGLGAPGVLARNPPPRFKGRGIVVCGGGPKYFPCAWVCIRMLRHVGCALPIELWHAGEAELPYAWRSLVEPFGVRCVDADEVRQLHPVRALGGWPLKPYALLHSSFEEVMGIDADNVAVRDPAYLFDAPEYRAAGALFWPDYERLAPDRAIWRLCGVPWRDEEEIESGQLLIHKRRCWRPLNLTMHLNEHSDFYYQYIHGDKETFHMAWRMLDLDYAMIPHPVVTLEGTMCQHDFQGRRVFQHRNMLKWRLDQANLRVAGFEFEDECLSFLDELRGSPTSPRRPARTDPITAPV